MAWVAAIVKGGASAIDTHQQMKLKEKEEEALREGGRLGMAVGTVAMREAEREKEFMHSRAVALAAASGGGVDDASTVKLLGDLEAEGEYRVMSRLWVAQNDYEGMIAKADAAHEELKAMRIAGVISAITAAGEGYAQASGG